MRKITKLKSGLTLLYQEMPDVRSVSIGVFVKVGSVYENANNNGISHFIEHTVFKGTERRTAFDIVAETDNMGAAINAYTSKTATCYYVQCIDTDAEKSFDILSDIFFNSTFPEAELNKEKGVVLEEIAMCNDTPDDLSYENATTAYYKGHSIGRPILGSKKNVQAFTREDILSYMAKHYNACNTVLSIAGNIGYEQAEDLANRYFNDKFTRVKCKNTKISKPVTNSVYVKKIKKIEQGNINIVFPSTTYGEDMANAARILNSVFGYGMSSRLYQQIRESLGLAYSVYSYLSSYTFDGHASLYIGTNVDNVEKAVIAVRDEIKKLKDGGISAEELERGKAQIKSSLILSSEGSINAMMLNGKHAARTGELFDIDDMVAKIDAVDMDGINAAIAFAYDVSKATVSYVGPSFDKNLLEILQK